MYLLLVKANLKELICFLNILEHKAGNVTETCERLKRLGTDKNEVPLDQQNYDSDFWNKLSHLEGKLWITFPSCSQERICHNRGTAQSI